MTFDGLENVNEIIF